MVSQRKKLKTVTHNYKRLLRIVIKIENYYSSMAATPEDELAVIAYIQKLISRYWRKIRAKGVEFTTDQYKLSFNKYFQWRMAKEQRSRFIENSQGARAG